MKTSIANHTEYFEVLAKLDDEMLDYEDKDEYENAVRAYLLSLSEMKREQIGVHAPNAGLRENHELRLKIISSGPHNLYLNRLARASGLQRIPRTTEELKTNAVVGAAMAQRRTENAKQRVKEKGRIVQCQQCAGFFYSPETERIKPYGSNTYMRFCTKCAEEIKLAKKIFAARR